MLARLAPCRVQTTNGFINDTVPGWWRSRGAWEEFWGSDQGVAIKFSWRFAAYH